MSSGGGSYWYEGGGIQVRRPSFWSDRRGIDQSFFVDGVLKHVDDVSFELVNDVTAVFEPYADSWCAVGAIEMYNDNFR